MVYIPNRFCWARNCLNIDWCNRNPPPKGTWPCRQWHLQSWMFVHFHIPYTSWNSYRLRNVSILWGILYTVRHQEGRPFFYRDRNDPLHIPSIVHYLDWRHSIQVGSVYMCLVWCRLKKYAVRILCTLTNLFGWKIYQARTVNKRLLPWGPVGNLWKQWKKNCVRSCFGWVFFETTIWFFYKYLPLGQDLHEEERNSPTFLLYRPVEQSWQDVDAFAPVLLDPIFPASQFLHKLSLLNPVSSP